MASGFCPWNAPGTFNIQHALWKFPERTLTPALSHLMGEEDRKTRLSPLTLFDLRKAAVTSLSHRMGEGQGEGWAELFDASVQLHHAIKPLLVRPGAVEENQRTVRRRLIAGQRQPR